METLTLASAITSSVQADSAIAPARLLTCALATGAGLASPIVPSLTLSTPIELEEST